MRPEQEVTLHAAAPNHRPAFAPAHQHFVRKVELPVFLERQDSGFVLDEFARFNRDVAHQHYA